MTFTVLFMGSLFVMVSNNSIQITWCNGWKKQSFFCLFVFSWRACNENSVWVSFCCCLVTKSCLTLSDPMGCSTPVFPVHQQLPELAQTHVHRVSDAIQPFHPLSLHSPSAFNLSQSQGLYQWVSSSHQMAKVLKLQHQSFQWIFRTDFL